MQDRLKHVINELYKNKQRRVFALSRAEAEQLPGLPHVAVISITTAEHGPAELGAFEHVLRLSFADVDHLSSSLTPRAKARIDEAFTGAQAHQILDFARALPPRISAVVVHCGGGFSRSCAVAMALHEQFGLIAELERLQAANPSVLALLREAGRSRPF